MRVASTACREARGRYFEQRTSFLQALDVVLFVAEQQCDRFDHAVCRQVRDERSTTDEHLDQSLFGERLDGLAHRRAADAEPFGEISLRRNLVAGFESARQNLLLDLVDDLLVQPLLWLDR